MNREIHVRFWESLGVRFPWATQLVKRRCCLEIHSLDPDGPEARRQVLRPRMALREEATCRDWPRNRYCLLASHHKATAAMSRFAAFGGVPVCLDWPASGRP